MRKGTKVVVKACVFSSVAGLSDGPTYSEVMRQAPTAKLNTGTVVREPEFQCVRPRRIWRYEVWPWEGMVVGWSHRQTGDLVQSRHTESDHERGYIKGVKRHLVVMVQPLHTDRYLRPSACLADDLEIV